MGYSSTERKGANIQEQMIQPSDYINMIEIQFEKWYNRQPAEQTDIWYQTVHCFVALAPDVQELFWWLYERRHAPLYTIKEINKRHEGASNYK